MFALFEGVEKKKHIRSEIQSWNIYFVIIYFCLIIQFDIKITVMYRARNEIF